MKYTFVINMIVVMWGCGNVQFGQQTGRVHSAKIPELNRAREALSVLRQHPALNTTGVCIGLFAQEHGIHATLLGRLISNDPDLVVSILKKSGQLIRRVFAQGSTPRDQVETTMSTLDPEQLMTQGVPIAHIEQGVYYQQDGWSIPQLRRSIGALIDKEKYVVQRIGENKKNERHAFLKGYEPFQQVARYLNNLPQEQLEAGVSLTEIANNVNFIHDSWSTTTIVRVISHYLDKDKYIVRKKPENGQKKTLAFPQGSNLTTRISAYLNSLTLKEISTGILYSQIAAAVNYTRRLPPSTAHQVIGQYLDKENYAVRRVNVDGKLESAVFPKDELILDRIKKLDPTVHKAGIPLDKIPLHL